MTPRVVGIDPSLTATGYANGALSFTTITYPKGCAGDQRLYELYRWLREALQHYKPDLVAIEDVLHHQAYGVGVSGMAQGVVRVVLMDLQMRYVSIPAKTLKVFATGRGGATKNDMRDALGHWAAIKVRDHNQVDARWLYEAGMHLLGHPTIELPASHTDALKKVKLDR